MEVTGQKALGGKRGPASNLLFLVKSQCIIPVLSGTQPWNGLNVLFCLTGQQAPALPIPMSCRLFFHCRAAGNQSRWGANPHRGIDRALSFFLAQCQIREMFLGVILFAVPPKTRGCTAPGLWRRVGKPSPSAHRCLKSCHSPYDGFGLGFVCEEMK